MLHHLPETRDMVGLVKNLIELFRQIDVNGDEQLDWDEFTGHIIEMGKYFVFLFFFITKRFNFYFNRFLIHYFFITIHFNLN